MLTYSGLPERKRRTCHPLKHFISIIPFAAAGQRSKRRERRWRHFTLNISIYGAPSPWARAALKEREISITEGERERERGMEREGEREGESEGERDRVRERERGHKMDRSTLSPFLSLSLCLSTTW